MRTPLPIVAELAPGADPGASPGTWAWTSDGVKWRTKSGIEISAGRDDEDGEVGPGECAVTFDDRTGKLSPRNVLGEWYGQLGKNTPARLILDSVADDFARVRSGTGWGDEPQSGATWWHTGSLTQWSTTGSAATVSITTDNQAISGFLREDPVGGDVDVYATFSISAAITGASWVNAIQLRRFDATNHYRMHTEFTSDGTVKIKINRVYQGSGLEIVGLTDTGLTYVPGTEIHVHAQAVGNTLQMRVWKGAVEPTTWNASAQDSSVNGKGFGIYFWRVGGNTNVGALTATVKDVRVRTNLYTGTVPEWPVRWPDKSGKDCTAPVKMSGLLRYLNQGAEPLKSPIELQMMGLAPAAYWNLQDGSNASNAGASTQRTPPATVVNAEFGSDDTPPGGLSAINLTNLGTSKVTGRVGYWAPTRPLNGFTAIIFAKFGALPAASPARDFFEVRAQGRVVRWVVTADAATFNMTGYDSADSVVSTTGGVLYGIDPTKWFAFKMETSQVGGNVSYNMVWHQVGDSSLFLGLAGSYSGTTLKPLSATVSAPVDNTLVTSLFVGSRDVPFNTGEFAEVSNGYAGELASDRIRRAADEAGLEVAILPGASAPLGPQPRAATALDVIRDAEKADLGLLFERGPVLAYIPHAARFNPAVALALDWSLGHLHDPPEPTDDDQRLRNQWTASRPSGSDRTVTDEASIQRFRRYPDGDQFNVQTDDQLADVAGWKVAEGTIDQMRWPRLSIDLIRNPELVTDWLGCEVGSRVTVANAPTQVQGEVIDLIIEGYTESIGKNYWTVELNLSPAAPWAEVGVFDTSRADSASTITASSFNASTTSIPIKTKDRDETWYTPGGYEVKINGEPMTVTAASSPVLSSGYFTQTLTVAARGPLAKAHVADEPVHLAAPVRYGY